MRLVKEHWKAILFSVAVASSCLSAISRADAVGASKVLLLIGGTESRTIRTTIPVNLTSFLSVGDPKLKEPCRLWVAGPAVDLVSFFKDRTKVPKPSGKDLRDQYYYYLTADSNGSWSGDAIALSNWSLTAYPPECTFVVSGQAISPAPLVISP
jgi:hypothetical protein